MTSRFSFFLSKENKNTGTIRQLCDRGNRYETIKGNKEFNKLQECRDFKTAYLHGDLAV